MPKRFKPSKLPSALRGYVCLEFAKFKNQWSDRDLDRLLPIPHTSKTLIHWNNRANAISPRYLARIIEEEPEVQKVYELPLWRLLENERITRPEINELLVNFNNSLSASHPAFPKRQYEAESELLVPGILSPAKNSRYSVRTDLPSFINTLAAARRAEWRGDRSWSEFNELVGYLFCALPSVGRIPWLKEDFFYLCSAVVNLQLRAPADKRSFHPDLRIIFGQQQQIAFEPSEYFWMESETPSLHFLANPVVDRGWQPEYCDIYELLNLYRMEGATSYSEIVSFEMDQTFTPLRDEPSLFLMLVKYWKLGRHTWEPILRMKTLLIAWWMRGDWDLDEFGWKRMMNLLELAGDLEHRGFGPDEQCLWMRRDFGDGVSPMQLIEQGEIDSAIALCRNVINEQDTTGR